MIESNTLFLLASITFAIGMLLLLKRVIKVKGALNDFDLLGSAITAMGTVIMGSAFIITDQELSLIFLTPTLIFWSVVTGYKIFSNRIFIRWDLFKCAINQHELCEETHDDLFNRNVKICKNCGYINVVGFGRKEEKQ